MGLLNKLKVDKSNLTDLDGKTPASYDRLSKYAEGLKASQLDLDGKTPIQYNGVSKYAIGLAKSQLDLDGKKPNIPGKYPYLDNLPE